MSNPLPDPSLSGHPWSDSVLQALYDAVHAAAPSLAAAMKSVNNLLLLGDGESWAR